MHKKGLAQGSGLVLLLALILLPITNYYLPVSECFAEEEEFVITTYYPSPYGSYNELTTYSNTYLATGSGNVGIGTSSPNYKLDVTGALRATSNTYLATTSGNVGIGTLSPGQKLTVAGMMETTSGGLKFPDGTIQTTASSGAITGVTAGTCLEGGGTSGVVTLNLATTVKSTKTIAASGGGMPVVYGPIIDCPSGQYVCGVGLVSENCWASTGIETCLKVRCCGK